MVEIRKLGKNDYNWAVFRDGVHVDALVILVDDQEKKWRLWKNKERFTESERHEIQVKLDYLNSVS